MNSNILRSFKIGIASVAFFGIVAIASAAPATWTAPTATAPGANAAAPINVSSVAQSKRGEIDMVNSIDSGWLNVAGRSKFSGGVQIASGSPANGKVLTATDASGDVTWAAPATGTSGTSYWTASGSNISNTNSGSIDVGPIDPTYASSYKTYINGPTPGKVLGLQSGGSTIWDIGMDSTSGANFQIGNGGTADLLIGAITHTVAVPGSLTVGGKNVCLQDGTNCPASAASSTSLYVASIACDAYTNMSLSVGATVTGNPLADPNTSIVVYDPDDAAENSWPSGSVIRGEYCIDLSGTTTSGGGPDGVHQATGHISAVRSNIYLGKLSS